MTTLNYKGMEYNVVYVDPSISSAGDGSTYDNALQTLPSAFESGTCYLIRRTSEEYFCDKNGNYDDTATSLMLMGMPKPNDEFYSLITDEDVKLAWADEEYDYANVKFINDSASSINFKNLSELNLSRLYCFRKDNGYLRSSDNSHGSDRKFYGYCMMYINNGNLYIDNCKFGYHGTDINKTLYLNNNEQVSDSQRYGLNGYVSCNNSNSVILKNTIINHSSTTSGPRITYYSDHYFGTGFNFIGCKNITLDNVILNTLWGKDFKYPQSNYSGFYGLHNGAWVSDANSGLNIPIYCAYCNNFVFKNSTINSIANSDMYLPPYPIVVDCGGYYQTEPSSPVTVSSASKFGYVDVSNITYNITKCKNAKPNQIISYKTEYQSNPSGRQGDLSKSIGSMYFYGGILGTVKDITVNANIENAEVYAQNILTLDYRVVDSKLKSPHCLVKNVKATFAQSMDSVMIYRNDYQDLPAITVKTTELGKTTTNSIAFPDQMSVVEMKNIDINCPLGASISTKCSNISNSKFTGKLISEGNSNIDADYIINKNLSSKAVMIEGDNNTIKCDYLLVDFDNGYNNYNAKAQIGYSTNNYYGTTNALIKSTNAILFEDTEIESAERTNASTLVCTNYGSDKQFYQVNSAGKVVSYQVHRQSSTPSASLGFTLRGELKDNYTLDIGSDRYSGINKTVENSGEKILNCYLYCVDNISNEDIKNKFNIEVTVPYKGTILGHEYDSKKVFESSELATVTDDVSVWNNISNGYAKKISFPITVVDDNTIIDIKVKDSLVTHGIVYLDPNIEIN